MVYWNVLIGRLAEGAEEHHETAHSGQTVSIGTCRCEDGLNRKKAFNLVYFSLVTFTHNLFHEYIT